MSERMRLQRKTPTSVTGSTQTAFVPPGSLGAAFTPTPPVPTAQPLSHPPTVAPAATEPQAKVPSPAFRGHDFRRVAVVEGIPVSRSDDPAQQAADWAVEQKLRSRASAQVQTKPIQPPRGFDFRQVSIFPPERGNFRDRPSASIQRPAIAKETVDETATQAIQPKLAIGQPDDQYEQEADRVAAQVMSMPDAAIQHPIQREATLEEDELQTKPLAASITPLVQRDTLLEEAEVQAKCEVCEQEEQVQRSSRDVVQAQPDLESRLNGSKGGGSPLPDEVRSFMEPRFGTDFSQVRVHTNSSAVQMNRELSAQAFTHGRDVYFGAGKFPANDALTAHELTHVVQQTSGVHAEAISLSKLDSVVTQSASSPMLQLKHLTIPEAVKSFKDVVTPSNEAPGSTTLVESGQFYWTEQIRFAIGQQILFLRFIPAHYEWQELLNDLDKIWKQWPLDKAAQDSQTIKQKIAGIRERAKKSDPIAISLLPFLPVVEPLLKPAPKSGQAIYYELWSHLQKGDQIPSLVPYQSLPTLQAISSWEIQACGFTGSQAATRYTRKGGVKKENPDAKRGNSTKVGASFAGNATRDMRLTPGGLRLGDVLNQNGVASAVPKMQAALDDGWILHARVLSGVDYGHGDAAAAFDKQAANGKAPKQPQPLGKPPEEHSIMIIGYDGNEFVFWDPDSGSSNARGAGFGSLFFSGGKLSTAKDNADLAVDIAGNHGGSAGRHRYQVIHLGSQ